MKETKRYTYTTCTHGVCGEARIPHVRERTYSTPDYLRCDGTRFRGIGEYATRREYTLRSEDYQTYHPWALWSICLSSPRNNFHHPVRNHLCRRGSYSMSDPRACNCSTHAYVPHSDSPLGTTGNTRYLLVSMCGCCKMLDPWRCNRHNFHWPRRCRCILSTVWGTLASRGHKKCPSEASTVSSTACCTHMKLFLPGTDSG